MTTTGASATGQLAPRTTGYDRRRTSDRDEAEQIISDLYLPNRLDMCTGLGPLDMEVAGLRLGAITAGRLSYGRALRLQTESAANFHVNMPLSGRAVSRRGAGDAVVTTRGQALVFSPEAPADISWSSDCAQICLMIPRATLEGELERLAGRSLRQPLVFDFAVENRRQQPGHLWATLMSLLAGELHHPTGVVAHARVARHIEGLVLDGLLLGQRHNYSELAARPATPGPRSAIRRAVELVEERPADPWTTVSLAREVHLSVRALQEGFSRDLQMPPMAYVRRLRLRRVHQVLLLATRETTTVQAVATGYGFLHMSRFSTLYREAFGESPSQTLGRRAP